MKRWCTNFDNLLVTSLDLKLVRRGVVGLAALMLIFALIAFPNLSRKKLVPSYRSLRLTTVKVGQSASFHFVCPESRGVWLVLGKSENHWAAFQGTVSIEGPDDLHLRQSFLSKDLNLCNWLANQPIGYIVGYSKAVAANWPFVPSRSYSGKIETKGGGGIYTDVWLCWIED